MSNVQVEVKNYVAVVTLNRPPVNATSRAVREELIRRGHDAADAAAKKALVDERFALVNAEVASYESLKKFAIIDRPLTVEDGLLTATLKVRRKKVYEAFRDAFEALYT